MAATNYSPIQLYYSTTASAAPAAGNLVSGELAINITDGKLYYKDNAGTVQLLSTSTTANGTANGVLYLNGSKVATSGSALTFNGAGILTVSSAVAQINLTPTTTTNNALYRATNAGGTAFIGLDGSAGGLGAAYCLSIYHTGNYPIVFSTNGSEQMRLTNTGLGIGTSSAGAKLHSSKADGGYVFAVSGTTKGMRVSTDANQTLLQGVDNTLTGSYQPLSFGGSILLFQTNGTTEAMRLDASGNVGIGTSSPSTRLTIGGYSSANQTPDIQITRSSSGTSIQTGPNITFTDGTTNNTTTLQVTQGRFGVWNYGGSSWAERMSIDASGNLGLGVTPSAWGSNWKTSQIGLTGALASTGSGSTSPAAMVLGAYNDNTNWKYQYSSVGAARYEMTGANAGSTHAWYVSAGGTANAAITFTQAMTLDASGNWMNGTTTAIGRATVVGGGTSQLAFHDGNGGSTNYGYLNYGGSSGELTLNANSSGGNTLIRFLTSNSGSNAERARIDSSGNLLVGTTSANPTNGFVANANSGNGFYLQIGHPTGTVSGVAYTRYMYNQTEIGSITQSGTSAVLYNVTSDQRLKENIIDAPEFGSVIDLIKVRSYDWKADGNHQRYGFVAQELVTVAPEAVHQPADPEQMMAVDYSKLVPMLVKEIQSLRARVAQLESN